jgi:hypothetical protein
VLEAYEKVQQQLLEQRRQAQALRPLALNAAAISGLQLKSAFLQACPTFPAPLSTAHASSHKCDLPKNPLPTNGSVASMSAKDCRLNGMSMVTREGEAGVGQAEAGLRLNEVRLRTGVGKPRVETREGRPSLEDVGLQTGGLGTAEKMGSAGGGLPGLPCPADAAAQTNVALEGSASDCATGSDVEEMSFVSTARGAGQAQVCLCTLGCNSVALA